MEYMGFKDFGTWTFTISEWITTFTTNKSIRTILSNVRFIEEKKLFFNIFLLFFSQFLLRWKRALKKYLITYPFVMSCLGLSLLLFFVYHRIQIRTDRNYPLDISTFLISSKYIRMVPSIGYSLMIIPLNLIYKKLAEYLTDFGNLK